MKSFHPVEAKEVKVFAERIIVFYLSKYTPLQDYNVSSRESVNLPELRPYK